VVIRRVGPGSVPPVGPGGQGVRQRRPLIGVQAWLILLLVVVGLIAGLPGGARAEAFTRVAFFAIVSGETSRVEVPDAPDLTPTAELTIEAWVRPSHDRRCFTVLSKDFESAYWFGLCNDRISFNSNGTASGQTGPTAIPRNIWTHIAVTWRAGGERRYYLNGDHEYTGPAGPAPTANGSVLYLGANPGGELSPWEGHLAEVRLWGVARSQDEIRRGMHGAQRERLPGAIAAWPLVGDIQSSSDQLVGHIADAVGGHHGVARNVTFTDLAPPAQPVTVPVDTAFNRLPVARHSVATAHVPSLNRLILAGGRGRRE
jgi:hypothetical protein